MKINRIFFLLFIISFLILSTIKGWVPKHKRKKEYIPHAAVDQGIQIVVVTSKDGISINLRRITYAIHKLKGKKWGLTYFESNHDSNQKIAFCLFDFILYEHDSNRKCVQLTEFSDIRLETCHFSSRGPFDINPWMLVGTNWNLPQLDRSRASIPLHRAFRYDVNSTDNCILPSRIGKIHHSFKLKDTLLDKARLMIKQLFIDDSTIQNVDGILQKKNPIYFAFHWRRGDQLTNLMKCKKYNNPLVCDKSPEILLRRLKEIHPLWYIATDEKDISIRNSLTDGLPGLTIRLLPTTIINQEGPGSAFFMDIAMLSLAKRFYAVRFPSSSVRLVVEHFRKQVHNIPFHYNGDTVWLQEASEIDPYLT